MYDALIIGAGPAGYSCAERIAALGGKAVVFDRDGPGGTCTNYGCIPTKALHACASVFLNVKNASRYGISVSSSALDFSAVMARKSRIVSVISKGVGSILHSRGVELVRGEAILCDPHTVAVDGNKYQGRNLVIASGARPKLLPGVCVSDFVLTSKEMLSLSSLPLSIVIVGGGYIGCEFASILSSFGVKVTILEFLPRLVINEDESIAAELLRIMERRGVSVHTSAQFLDAQNGVVEFSQNGEKHRLPTEKVLIAVGTEPVFDRALLQKWGVRSDRGIVVNEFMETTVPGVYAIGDVTGQVMLAHYAYAQAEVCADVIMGKKRAFDAKVVPSVIFTLPEIASVGVRNSNLPFVSVPFAAVGKARAMDASEGFVKIYYQDGFLEGFCAIGPHASDLVAEATLAITHKISLACIASTIHVHPTLPEAFLMAVQKAVPKEKIQ